MLYIALRIAIFRGIIMCNKLLDNVEKSRKMSGNKTD